MAQGFPSDPGAQIRQAARLRQWRRKRFARRLIERLSKGGLGIDYTWTAVFSEIDRWNDDTPTIAPDFVELGMAGFGPERAAAV